MRLYHVSRNPNLTTLIPMRPRHFLTVHGLENGRRKRISFGRSVKGCLRALDGGGKPGEDLYVYSPISINPKYLYRPTRKEVPDSRITNEYWYLRPVNVKLVAVVHRGKIVNPKVFYFDPHSSVFGLSHGYEYETKLRYRNGRAYTPYKPKPKEEGLLERITNYIRGKVR